MGRRVFYKEEVAGEVTKHHRFVYDNYLCVQKLDALNNNSQLNLFVWDPTESVATRPLFMVANPGNYKLFYTFDGNKNVSELVHFESRNGIAAHYDYAPFGAVTRAVNASAISDRNFHLENPFRFSSEYHDDTLGLVYYNYRHYNPIDGRWSSRDPLEDVVAGYLFVSNQRGIDLLGLQSILDTYEFDMKINRREIKKSMGYAPRSSIAHQVVRYKTEIIWDTYRVKLDYKKECFNKSIAYIHLLEITGNLVEAIDAWGFSVDVKGLVGEYSNRYEVERGDAKIIKLGSVTEIEVLVQVYKSHEVGFGVLMFSFGEGVSVFRELVGEKKIRLKHSCCE